MKGPDVGPDVGLRMNLGCAGDVKQGWTNVDTVPGEGVWVWDAKQPFPQIDTFDFVLINHVLCTMNINDADKVMHNVYNSMKIGGKVQVIDVDMLKAFEAYKRGDEEALFIPEGTIDYKLSMHLSGYGTRLSLYTPKFMCEFLEEQGFKDVKVIESSEYNTRPLESLIVEGTK